MGCDIVQMRTRFKAVGNKWVEIKPRSESKTADIMTDIKPYKSMITGETITSRSHHRNHLRDHECVEVGNETATLMNHYDKLPNNLDKSRHELVKAQVSELSHDQLRAMVKKEVKRIRRV